eukprot:g3572.t1
MVNFQISFSNLQEFNVNVLNWRKLVRLNLFYNKISSYNKESLWTHPNIRGVDIRDNVGMELPSLGNVEVKMPFLQYLHIGNNSVDINMNFNDEAFPNLLYLYLNGNNLLIFPDESLKGKILYLAIARCNVENLPPYLSEFNKLQYLDARDNNITVVDNNLKALIEKNIMETYFARNPVCNNDINLQCNSVCSKFCWSSRVSKNGRCDLTCNSDACEYDGGDCNVS